jgi:energy-coupling factor transporter ATP-binding protein EcfA2
VIAAVEDTAAVLASWTLARPPTLGAGRLVCVDGPAGSGKTTLGAALRRAFRDQLRRQRGDHGIRSPDGVDDVALVHMDNLYDGWHGLEEGVRRLTHEVVDPLRGARPGRYRRFDWLRLTHAEERVVSPVRVLVVEGVGSAPLALDDVVTCLVWVDTPADLRHARGLARDGEQSREDWEEWVRREGPVLDRERARERAHVVVDGTGMAAEQLRWTDRARAGDAASVERSADP